ncbi:MAG TPA: caspase family protein [Thermoanaerobaculia bacterium]|nr:caspase family protein [Thermoanaerobaculia bacterium]
MGIRRFTRDTSLVEVPYAVDDAIDLAYAVSLERNVKLVLPERVALAISGDPQKPDSKLRLEELERRGATVLRTAGQVDVLTLLEKQARSAGKGGVFIVGFATHGFTRDGMHYLISETSLLQHPETALPAHKVLDIAARSEADRSLVFLDACRERVTAGSRTTEIDPSTAAPVLEARGRVSGQVVFYAAAAGQYAFDDEERKNGVFTSAVLDGLRCSGLTNPQGHVTVELLASAVEMKVRSWVRKHRHPAARVATQVSMDGETRLLPLAFCKVRPAPSSAPPPDSQPARAASAGAFVTVFGGDGLRLWGKEVEGEVAQTEVADLDGDGRNEVIVGVAGTGEDSGSIVVLDASGAVRWKGATAAPFNYGDGRSGGMVVQTFAVGDLDRNGRREVVALAVDAQGWYPSRLCIFDDAGGLRAAYWHPGHLQHVLITSVTARHAPRIVVSGINNDVGSLLQGSGRHACVFMLDPRKVAGEAPPYFGKLAFGSQLWYGVVRPSGQNITRLETVDRDNDGRRDISFRTSTGQVFYLNFDGMIMAVAHMDDATGTSHFELIARK